MTSYHSPRHSLGSHSIYTTLRYTTSMCRRHIHLSQTFDWTQV